MTASPPHREPAGLAAARHLARRALPFWGVRDCEPELLKYRENAVFRIVLPEGRPAALRVHRLSYHSDAALRSELQWMAYLRASGIAAPSPVPAVGGDLFVSVGDAGNGPMQQVDCIEWLEGRPLGATGAPLAFAPQQSEAIFTELGRTLARIHDASSVWTLPRGFTRHAWDFGGFFGDKPTWGPFHASPLLDADCRDLVERAHGKAASDLAGCERTPQNFGLIHADLVRENILVRDAAVQVIDFDDCGFGWHMYDIAVALYRNRDEANFPRLEAALLEGYRSVRGLTPQDIALLPLFTVLRTFALIGWVQTRSDPRDDLAARALVSDHTRKMVRWYLNQG